MNVLFDLNIILDLLLAREPWLNDARAAVDLISRQHIDGYISAASIPTLFYIARRVVGRDGAFATVKSCLSTFRIAEINEETIKAALHNRQHDFEDDLQVAAAHQAHCEAIITRDFDRFPNTQIHTMTPRDLYEQFAGGSH
jgi:predicted nucleic acid-binding protein